MNREELIKEAAKAILRADNDFDFNEGQSEDTHWLRALAEAALSVVEQAGTPTDAEREALTNALHTGEREPTGAAVAAAQKASEFEGFVIPEWRMRAALRAAANADRETGGADEG